MLASIITSIVTLIFTACMTALLKQIKKQSGEIKANTEGTKCLLWYRLSDDYDRYTELGFCPADQKKRIEQTYKAYHALGGNGVGTQMFEELLKLPNHKF